MSSVVLDASAGVEIALRTLPGRRFEKRLADHRVFVPEIFYSEVAGVLRRKTARDEIAVQRAAEALRRLLSLRTSRASVKPLIIQAWELRQNLILADALYVVLARQLHAPLISGDHRLSRAPNLGIHVIVE